MEKIFMNYCKPVIRKKKKGTGKGVKISIDELGWDESKSRREYLHELASINKTECGLFLCKVEFTDLLADRWWDVPNYRANHLANYRRKITAIRKEYELSNTDVKQFMRIG